MKSLIIGAAGFVGAYLIQHLKKDLGHDIAVTKLPNERIRVNKKVHPEYGTDSDRNDPDRNDSDRNNSDRNNPDRNDLNGNHDLDKDDLDIYDLDILDQDSVLKLMQAVQPDYVFHLAAQSSVAAAWKHPGMTVDVNIRGAVHVLEAVRRMQKRPRILLVGSGEEYGLVRPQEIPISEENRLYPGNIYAATKACQTMIGGIYARAYGVEAVMVRAFNHIGPNQEPLFAVADFCRQVAWIEAGRQEAVLRVGNVDARRDFTDVRDVVRAYAMLAEKGKAGEIYNVGSGRAVSIAHMIELILKKSAASITVEQDASKVRPVDLPVIEADIRKLQTATGWQPRIGLEQTITETLGYWRYRALADG